jgi:[methyl-Co(III) methylamine-specific corrinoid protein]:coenzyme M methyltransferase
MNEWQRLNAMLNGEYLDRPPCICPMHTATTALMKAAGAYYPQVQDDPHKMARLAEVAYTEAGIENVRIPFDESVEVSAFGAITGHKGATRHPIVLQHLVRSAEEIDSLHVPDPLTSGRTKVVIKAAWVLDNERKTLPVLLGIISPLMLAMQLRGDHELMMDMFEDPPLVEALLEKATTFLIDYTRGAAEAGVDMIVIDDSLSSGDFLTYEQFDRYSEPYDDRIANEARNGDIESILHICGNLSVQQLERMVEVDVNAISIDQDVPIGDAKRIAGRRNMKVIGSLCPTRTLLMGDTALVEEVTKRCLNEGVDAVAPGCSLELYTPTENLRAMVDTTKQHGRAIRRAR